MTKNHTKSERSHIIHKTIFIGGCILFLFAFLGDYIFKLFGISLASFQIAGGILIITNGFYMMQAKQSPTRFSSTDHLEMIDREDIAVFPLATPLLVGPGTISTSILIMSSDHSVFYVAIFILAALTALAASYFVLRLTEPIMKHVGQMGLNLITRLMGIIICAVAVEFIIKGIRSFFI